MIKDLDNKILLSIAYTDQFKYPLTKQEIFLRLIGVDNSISLNKVRKELDKLVFESKIFFNKGFYFLRGGESYLKIRLKREKYSQKKWLEVKAFTAFIKHIPWINGVAITGSLAVSNARENDDVDFLVVTEKNRLWLIRVVVVLFSFLKGKKRSWNKDEANSWCLNLWLDSESLELPKELKNVYGAFEVSQAVWIFDRNNTKNKFFKKNGWAREFLPNYYDFQKNNKTEFISDKNNKFFTIGFLLSILNTILFLIQYLYMKPHMTREKVAKNFAFFHPRDTKKQIFRKWLRKLNEVIV